MLTWFIYNLKTLHETIKTDNSRQRVKDLPISTYME